MKNRTDLAIESRGIDIDDGVVKTEKRTEKTFVTQIEI